MNFMQNKYLKKLLEKQYLEVKVQQKFGLFIVSVITRWGYGGYSPYSLFSNFGVYGAIKVMQAKKWMYLFSQDKDKKGFSNYTEPFFEVVFIAYFFPP